MMTVVTVTLNPCIDKSFSVERVVAEDKLSAEDVREDPGGGGINVARVATRLEADVRAIWTCGGDLGHRLQRLLEAEEIRHEPILIEGEVRENLIICERGTGHQYRFSLPGPSMSEDEQRRAAERVAQVCERASYVVFSGSLPQGMENIGYDAFLDAVPSGVRTIVDTKKDALRRVLDRGVHLIKPNVRELGEVVGRELHGDDDVVAAGRDIIGRGGAEVVFVSLGRGGALLVTAEGAQRYGSPSVSIRSKVGAGDSMVGGLVAALDRGRSLEEAACFAIAGGAAAVMTDGTELSRPEDVYRLEREVCRMEARA